MATYKSLILKGLLLCHLFQTVIADGHVSIQVQILQYDNPLGTSFNKLDISSQRKCCDGGHLPSCSSTDSCDSMFHICIGGIRNGVCIGPNVTTAALNNKNSFATSYDNTIVHSFTWNHWQSGAIEYIADVFDKDGGNKELIDNFTSTTALRADINYEHSTTQILSFKDFVSLDVGIRIWCQDGYSGHDCSTKCTDNTYSICTKNNGHTAFLQSCNSDEVSTFKLNPGSSVPINYTPFYLRQLFTQFFLREVCSDAHDVSVEILHFDIDGTIEFQAICDNVTQSSLLFTEHIYLLSLTDKATLGRYFPHIPLRVPSVHQQLPRGSKMLIMLRPIRYHDSTTQCGPNDCTVQIKVCLKAGSNGNCQVTISMQSNLTSSVMTICDGALLKSTPALQGHNIVSVSSWPVFQVNASYSKHNKWQNHQQPPATYKAGTLYDKAKPFQMTFSSGSKSLVLEAMIWCDTHHRGDHCQYSCSASGNKICDKNGHLVCKEGYHGSQCIDNNECQGSNPCKNSGTCHNTQGSFICQCQPYWTGRLCDVDVDECSLGLCTNATSCANHKGGFLCHCEPGFRGRYCAESDECKLPIHVCQHNGTCMNQYGSYSCICPPGYTGNRCEIVDCMKECGSHSYNCTKTNGHLNCKCDEGWKGNTCQSDIDECQSNPCHNGTCTNTAGNYSCSCFSGYAGRHCENDFDECELVHCANNGTCVNLPYPQRYRCDCLKGWDPKSRCHHHTDQCKILQPCVHGKCTTKNGNYICTCDNGWTGKNCSTSDMCNERPCINNGTCLNKADRYLCYCNAGWTGENCSFDIDECSSIKPCMNNGKCKNIDGGYMCKCEASWTGQNCSLENILQPTIPISTILFSSLYQRNNTMNSNIKESTDEVIGSTLSKLKTNLISNTSQIFKETFLSTSSTKPYNFSTKMPTLRYNESSNTFPTLQNIISRTTKTTPTMMTNNTYTFSQITNMTGSSASPEHPNISTSSSTSNEKYTNSESSAFTSSTVQYLTRKETSVHITSYAGETSTFKNNTTTNETIKHLLTTEQQKTSILSQTTTPTLQYTDLNSIKMYNQRNITTEKSFTTKVQLLLEDAISPKCSSSGWNITLDIPTLTKLYPDMNINQVHFGDNSCKGKVFGAKLVFIQGFRECLTVERISGDTILYNNKLFYAIYDPIHPYIIRQHKWTYGVECDINRNEVTSSHVHHNVETHNSVLSGQYSVNMTFFKDPGYMNQLPGNPLQIKVGDDVYVKVFTTASDWNIKMRLHTCFTKPNKETTNMTYYIIKNGCEVDSNTHIISQSTHETRFVFQDFEYSTNEEGLNIYCNATFCESKDYSTGCSQSCIPDN